MVNDGTGQVGLRTQWVGVEIQLTNPYLGTMMVMGKPMLPSTV